jgi:hypothetical protein
VEPLLAPPPILRGGGCSQRGRLRVRARFKLLLQVSTSRYRSYYKVLMSSAMLRSLHGGAAVVAVK